MGWDCTLHVVDDTTLAKFAARFLRGLHRTGAFDREFDGDALIANVKQLIADDPEDGARALGELALLYVATETPHLSCRDFALSLWDRAVLGAELPAQLLTSVETRIPDVIAAYPKLAGLVPTKFDGNVCVGPYVPARNVPALLAHVEKVLGGRADAIRYRPLLDILRVAAAHNLAYWEGTDIAVSTARTEWLPVHETSVTVHPNRFTSPTARVCALDGARILVADHFALHEIDTSTFPPTVLTHDDMQVNAAAFTPWGTTFVRMATDRTARPFKFSYFELPDRTPLPIEPPFAVGSARRAGDCLLLFPQPTTTERSNVRPLIMRADHRLEPMQVPEPVETRRVESDAIPFTDKEWLVLWDAVAYRWDGAGPPVLLGVTLDAPEELCSVTQPDGAIIAGFGHALSRIDRDGVVTPVLPLTNVMLLARGPGDVVIIGEGDSPDGDALKIYWPTTHELTRVARDLLGLAEPAMFAYYDPRAELLVVARAGSWHAVPWHQLAALRRVRAD
jgi:hypothetical protein